MVKQGGGKKRFKINEAKMNFRVNMVPIFASNYSTMQHVNRLASDIQQNNILITNIITLNKNIYIFNFFNIQ